MELGEIIDYCWKKEVQRQKMEVRGQNTLDEVRLSCDDLKRDKKQKTSG